MDTVVPEGKLLNLIKHAEGKKKLHKELKIFTKITFGLIGLIVIILIIFLVDMLTFKYKIPKLAVDMPKVSETKPTENDFDKEMDRVNTETAPPIKNNGSVPREEIIGNLSILGIITGDTSDQVIIEDRRTKETFFLYKGNSFKDFTIFDIRKDSVILDYNGEKIELNM